jgi:hypothetical protein
LPLLLITKFLVRIFPARYTRPVAEAPAIFQSDFSLFPKDYLTCPRGVEEKRKRFIYVEEYKAIYSFPFAQTVYMFTAAVTHLSPFFHSPIVATVEARLFFCATPTLAT